MLQNIMMAGYQRKFSQSLGEGVDEEEEQRKKGKRGQQFRR